MKTTLVWISLLLAMSAAPSWAQSPSPRVQSADPKATEQGIQGRTPRFESATPGATQKFTPRRKTRATEEALRH